MSQIVVYYPLAQVFYTDENLVRMKLPFGVLYTRPNNFTLYQTITIYDSKNKQKVEASVQEVDFNNGHIEVLVLKDTMTSVKETAIIKNDIPSHNRKQSKQFSAYGLASIITSLAFYGLIAVFNPQAVLLSLAYASSLELQYLFNTFSADEAPIVLSYLWLILLIPIFALYLSSKHWKDKGDPITGVTGTVISSLTMGLIWMLFVIWLQFKQLIPKNFIVNIDNFNNEALWPYFAFVFLSVLISLRHRIRQNRK